MELKTKINMLLVGIVISFLAYMLVYALVARIIVVSLIDYLVLTNSILFVILLVLLLISLLSSLFVGLLLSDDLDESNVLKASMMSYACNLVSIILISYFFLYITHPEAFTGISGLELILVFPSVVLLFSILCLGHPVYLGVLSILMYYGYFIIFLEKFERG